VCVCVCLYMYSSGRQWMSDFVLAGLAVNEANVSILINYMLVSLRSRCLFSA